MAQIHPLAAQALAVPLLVQERLPAGLQVVDLESIFGLHLALSLGAASFTVHPGWTLPLAVLGFVVTSQQMLPTSPNDANALIIFSLLWLLTVPIDIVWLLRHSDQAATIAIFALGMNMCFKVVSLVACSTALLHLGVIDGNVSSSAASRVGPGARSGGISFSSQSTLFDGRGAVRGVPTVPGTYRDDDARQQEEGRSRPGEEDAQLVTDVPVPSSAAAAPTNKPSSDDLPPREAAPVRGGYHTIE